MLKHHCSAIILLLICNAFPVFRNGTLKSDLSDFYQHLLLMCNAFVSAQTGCVLFVDTTLMVTNNLQRVFHSPDYYKGNPVLKADKKWELNIKGNLYAAPFSGGLWYAETDGKFKMWYSVGGEKRLGLITCYAESQDGKVWAKPDLGIVPGLNVCGRDCK